MSKLCQCRRDFLSSTILEIAARAGILAPLRRSEYTTSKAEEILKILESDCVCEKKDALHEYLSKENPKEQDKEVLLKAYGYLDVPKQSQSPCEQQADRAKPSQCEHQVEYQVFHVRNDLDKDPWMYPLFLCRKCGLVTCRNPNQE